jgi:hypothetical protein
LGAFAGGELFGQLLGDLADALGVGEGSGVVHAVGHGEVF